MFKFKNRFATFFLYLVLILLFLSGLFFSITYYGLQSTWFSKFVETKLEATLGRKVSLSKPLSLRIFPELAIVVQDFSISAPEGSEMLSVGEFLVSAQILQDWIKDQQLDLITLKDTKVVFSADKNGKSNWDFSDTKEKGLKQESASVAAKQESTWIPLVKRIVLDQVSLQFDQAEPWRSVDVRICDLETDEIASKSKLVCKLELDGQLLRIESKQASLNQLINSKDKKFNLKLRYLENALDTKLLLKANGELNASIKLSGKDLSSLSPLIKEDLPKYSDYRLSSNFSLDQSSSLLRFADLNLSLMGNDLQGELDIKLEPLSFKSKLVSKKLNLQQFVSQADSSSNDTQETDTAAKQQEPRFPFEAFKSFNADLDLQVDDLVTFLGLEFKNTQIVATILDGELNVSKLKANSLGAEINGSFSAKNRELNFEFQGKGFDANPIMLLSGGTPIIEGRFDLDANLFAKGELLSEIKKTLSGDIKLSTSKAEIKNTVLDSVSSGLMGILAPILGGKEKAQVPCMLFNYELKDGVAYSKEQVLKLGEAFIFAKGQLDIARDEIKYDFHVNSANPSLVSLVPPFKATGAIGSPVFMPSASATIASIVDTTEGVANSAIGVLGQGARLLTGNHLETLTGLDICYAAYKQEQSLITSQIGSALE